MINRIVAFLIAIGLLSIVGLAGAEAKQWQSAGPDGAYITAIAVDPQNDGTLYIGTLGGRIFKSTDFGAHWRHVGGKIKGSSFWPEFILSLAVDPLDSRIVYAGTSHFSGGVYKSADGGTRWKYIGLRGNDIRHIVIDPKNSANVYAVTSFSVAKSTNGGKRWVQSTKGLDHELSIIAIDPNDSRTLYVGGEGRLFISHNRGKKWSADGDFGQIRDITVSRTKPAAVYVATSDGLFRRRGHENWASLDIGVADNDFRAIRISPKNPSVLYVAHALKGVLMSEDEGRTWKPFNSGFPVIEVAGLTVGPRHPGVLYAVNGPALFKKTGTEQGWSNITAGLRELNIVALAIHPAGPNTLYAATCRDIFKTVDRGKSWQHILRADPCARALVVSPHEPTHVYVGTNDGIFESLDAGANWRRVGINLPNNLLALGVDPSTSKSLYATFDSGEGLMKTIDAGVTWRKILKGTIPRIAIDPRRPQRIYAAGYDRSTRSLHGQLFVSNDGGENWALTGLTSTFLGAIHSDVSIWGITVDPTDSNIIYAVGRDPGSDYGGVFKSIDGGKLWKVITSGLTSPASYSLTINPKNPKAVYVGTEKGVFESSDGGEHWNHFIEGLNGLNGESSWPITVDSTGTFLAVGTERGVFYRKLTGNENIREE